MTVSLAGTGGIPHLSAQVYFSTFPHPTVWLGSANGRHKQKDEEREESEDEVFISPATY